MYLQHWDVSVGRCFVEGCHPAVVLLTGVLKTNVPICIQTIHAATVVKKRLHSPLQREGGFSSAFRCSALYCTVLYCIRICFLQSVNSEMLSRLTHLPQFQCLTQLSQITIECFLEIKKSKTVANIVDVLLQSVINNRKASH